MSGSREGLMRQLCQYVRNTGQVPLPIEHFDDDHEPAGPMSRQMMIEDELIKYDGGIGGILLTAKGEALL